MPTLSEQQIETALATYQDPFLEQDLVSAKAIKNISVAGEDVTVDLELGIPTKLYGSELTTHLESVLRGVEGVGAVSINITSKIVAHSVQKGVKPLETSRTSSRWRPVKAVWASRRPRSTWHWHCRVRVQQPDCWTRTSTDPVSRACWGHRANRIQPTARRWSRKSATRCNPCQSVTWSMRKRR